jgi:hypothetical protein
MCTGSWLQVDGLGDGVMIEGPQELDFLVRTSFGMLQGCRMRNTKTVSASVSGLAPDSDELVLVTLVSYNHCGPCSECTPH